MRAPHRWLPLAFAGLAPALGLSFTLTVLPASAAADDITWGGSVDGGAPQQGKKRKPFEPDTALELTGEELAARGATNLAEALDLLPQITVKAGGRGGEQADIRGARKGWIKFIIDGVPVDDIYYGNFDLTSIPVTDIVEIRVSTAPASPLDGPGGPGGVIEVITLRASGERRLAARAQASDAPNASGWVTGRANVFPTLGVRVSAGGTFGAHDYDVTMDDGSERSLGEDTRTANAALRLESETDRGNLGLDLAAQHRSFVVPPGEENGADILVIDGEESARLGLWGETHARGWRLHARGHFQLLTRDSRSYGDATMTTLDNRENLSADRSGFSIAANRGLGAGFELVLASYLDTEHATVDNLEGRIQGGRSTVATVASGVQFRSGAWKADAAAGVSLPDGATPWPELKLSVGWQPIAEVGVELVGARKGRVPTLRERYQLVSGNEELDPETSTFVEASATVRPLPWLVLKTGVYAREVEQMIKIDFDTGMLANLGDVSFRGFDAEVRIDPIRAAGAGAAYRFIDADADFDNAGFEPLDFLPAHKLDGWVTLRLGTRAGGTGRVRFVDRRVDQREVLPRYVTTDLSAFYRIRTDLRATAKVDNLLDNRFDLRANGYRDPGRLIMVGVEGVWE